MPEKQQLKVYVTPEAKLILEQYCKVNHRSQTGIVEDLIREHLWPEVKKQLEKKT